ncbi:subtilisin-like protease [Grosmannia clavigera kw1407]|uniref:Subtilisin-like protease n=1 Tax=Grosmannia clavigera (strain kw1407 / UAMH 11150) TaxID=655863 RepID=F0XIS4_GROCL|nr:subtilisin-like protease [Grosmannia clavigera kw1407]EFX02302.1 subtilisin-like protease [Grosmannia clavigera kw1407]
MGPLAFLLLLGLLATATLGLPSPIPARHGTGQRTDRVLGVPIVNSNALNRVSNCYIVVYNANSSDSDIDAHQKYVKSTVAKHNLRRRAACNNTSSENSSDMSVSTHRIGSWRALSLQAAGDDAMVDIAGSSTVHYIEQDARVSTQALTTQTDATSGLVRLSHAAAGNSSSGYVFDASAGQGITAYVVDTGILVTHSQFAGRATFGANFVNSVNTDENGHGSHVAGTIGGTTFGVAKNVRLVAVKVLDADGGGTNSGVLAGLEWVAANATASGLAGKAVMNMSLGGSRSRSINAAVSAIKAAGVVACVAAGNDNVDAKTESPASSADAITVGAIDQTSDVRASFSNFGQSVDIFAPGVKVLSVGITSSTATEILSGTSMATPHIAGLAAYLMALENITDPSAVQARIQALASLTGADVTGNRGATTDLIANNGNQ